MCRNLWFEAELLSRKAAIVFQSEASTKDEEKCPTYFPGRLDLDEKSPLRFPFSTVHPEVRRSHIEFPILPLTRFDQSKRDRSSLSRHNGQTCSKHVFGTAFSSGEYSLAFLEAQFPQVFAGSFLEHHRSSLVQQALRIKFKDFLNIRKQGFDVLQQDDAASVILQGFFSRDLNLASNPISWPITRKSSLQPSAKTLDILDARDLFSEKSEITPRYIGLSRLERYVRHRHILELGLWSRGTRDILFKSKYCRQSLLQSVLLPRSSTLMILNEELQEVPLSSVYESSSRTFSCLDNLHSQLKHSGQSILTMHPKWRKFSRAINRTLQEELLAEDRLCRNKQQDKLLTYDTIKRNQPSDISSQLVLSRYERSRKQKEDSPQQQTQAKNKSEAASAYQDDDDSSSLFSLSNDIPEESNATRPLDALVGLTHECQDSKQDMQAENVEEKSNDCADALGWRQGRRRLDDGETAVLEKDEHIENHDNDSGRNNEVDFVPPHNFVCSPWSLKIAEFCVSKMKRGVVLLPPPLSIFPSVAAVVHSFVSTTFVDHRAVIICESETEMVSALERYLNFSYEGRVSIETVRRCECESFPVLASLVKTLATIVIVDSFDFSVTTDFSLLVILGPGTTSLPLLTRLPRKRHDGVQDFANNWALIPSIYIVPYHACNDVCSYLLTAISLANALNIDQALIVDESDDVHLSVLLSRPDFIFLVPPREILELVSVFETYASSYLAVYEQERRRSQKKYRSFRETEHLQDVNLNVLETFLTQRKTLTYGNRESFEILFALRQSRSYALSDGYQTALEYLKFYIRTATTEVSATLDSLLDEVQGMNMPDSIHHAKAHPMAVALSRSIDVMGKSMEQDAPSLQSIHRHYRFRPLIIANSKEACDGFLKAISGAVDILEVENSGIGVCENRHLRAVGKNGRMLDPYEREAQHALTKFSHVYHVLDDRSHAVSGETLPPHLLQTVHAGKTRLITITVDESRTLERLWRKNESMYSSICKAMRKCWGQQITNSQESYLLHLPLHCVVSSDVLASMQDETEVRGEPPHVVTTTNPHQYESAKAQVDRMTSKEGITNQELAELHISATAICALSISALRSKLREALRSIQGTSSHYRQLLVVVEMNNSERWSPATTFIFAALVGDKYLSRNIDVKIV